MGNPALIPLSGVAPPQQNPMDVYMRLQQIRGLQQQQGLEQAETQRANLQNTLTQRDISDQQGMRAAYIDAKGDPNAFLANVKSSKYGVSYQGIMAAVNGVVGMQKNLMGLTDEQMAQHQKIADLYNGFIKQVKDAPPNQRAQVWAQGAQQFQGLPGAQVPAQYPGDQDLDMLSYQGVSLSKLLDNAKTTADTSKATQQANEAAANAGKTNAEMQWYQQNGMAPGVGPDTQGLAAFLQNNPGKTAADYPAFKAGQEANARVPAQVAVETSPAVINARVGQAVATEVGKERALSPQLQQITNTTRSGRQYINRDDIPQGSAGVVEQQAAASGVPVVSKDVAGALSDFDTARANLDYMMNTVGSKLAKDPSGRLYSAPANTIAKLAQTDPELAAMGTYRNAAIQTLRAVAGSRGLRINMAEVQLAIDNDIPKATDTLPVAQAKLRNLKTFIDNAEQSQLIRNRNVTAPTAQGWGSQFGGVRRSQ